MSTRFIIFSLARCGSNNLVNLLRCHPDIRIIAEPFNREIFEGKYFSRSLDAESLDSILEEIWGTWNGIKHVWDSWGWPFGRHSELNKHLLSRRDVHIIFLTRKNDLQRVVSKEICRQTNIWYAASEHDKRTIFEFSFKPLDSQSIESELARDKKCIAEYRQLLKDNHLKLLELSYEDLCDSTIPLERRLDKLDEVVTWLGRTSIRDEANLEEVRNLLEHDNSDVRSHSIYPMIPGIEEVERNLGSDETGWLFKGQAAGDMGAPIVA